MKVVDVSLRRVPGDFKEQLARQRIAIGVQPVRGQTQQQVPGFHVSSVNDLAFIGNTHDESGQIVFAFRIEAGHLRGLAADQGATVVPAGLGDSFHDLLGNVRVEPAGRQVVHKEQRSGSLHSNVVNAVVYQVSADRVVYPHHESDFELGADAVDARNQDGFAELLLVDGEHAAEPADLADHALGERPVRQILDALLGAVSAVNIHPAVGVCDGSILQSCLALCTISMLGSFILASLTFVQTRASFQFVVMRVDSRPPASSLPTESSTPLMNWTDSGAENLRAISKASLITTGLGVSRKPRN